MEQREVEEVEEAEVGGSAGSDAGDSADLDQSFEVTGSGDNSNQCAGIQGAGNTGNSQNVIDLLQYEGETDDFEFEEVGSTVDVSPTNTTTCTSDVNQAASAAA